ncbi:MAG TPA: GTPase CgtA, partial [Ruminococcaceae bacterium]|nr:GTPase CgtA [Oscillospiraceae bacterium]
PIEDFKTINAELLKYGADLPGYVQIVAGNKCDAAEPDAIQRFSDFVEKQGVTFYPISAVTHQGTSDLVHAIGEKLSALPPVKHFVAEPLPEEDYAKEKDREISVEAHDNVYFVEGKWLLHVIENVNFGDRESLQYFQRVLRSSGVINKLVEAGIKEGDTVSIYDVEFDYVP